MNAPDPRHERAESSAAARGNDAEHTDGDAPPIIPGARLGERPTIPGTLPILPTRGIAVFPGVIASLSIGRAASRKLIEESLPQSKIIGLFAQKDPEKDNVGPDDLYQVGVAVSVMKLLRQPDDSGVVIVVSALDRIAIKKIVSSEPYLRAEIEVLHSAPPPKEDKQWQATVAQLRDSALELIALVPEAPT